MFVSISDSLNIAENDDFTGLRLNANSASPPSPAENSDHCCPFCRKLVSDHRKRQKHLFCLSCKTVDTVRPPIQISVEINPSEYSYFFHGNAFFYI
ncbi:hypothetical protein P9112_011339 [Eukaryota sp. TZLM1-RC]